MLLFVTCPALAQDGFALAEESRRIVGTDTTLALLLAREAVRADEGPVARSALYEAAHACRERGHYRGLTGPVAAIDATADGGEVLGASRAGEVVTWRRDGTRVARMECGAPVVQARYFADRILAATAAHLFLWARDGTPLAKIPARAIHVGRDRVVTIGEDGRAVLRDARGDVVAPLPLDGPAQLVFLAKDHVVTVDRTIRTWDRRGGLVATARPDGAVARAALSVDGRRLLVATDRGFSVWDLERSRCALQTALDVGFMAFAPDGSFYTAIGNELVLWEGLRQANRMELGEPAVGVRFGARHLLVTLAGGGTAYLRADLRRDRSPVPATAIARGPHGAEFVGARNGLGRLTSAARSVRLAGHAGAIDHARFVGKDVLTGGRDGTVRLWAGTAPDLLVAGPRLWGCGMPWFQDTIYTLSDNELGVWRTDGERSERVRFDDGIKWWAYALRSRTIAIVPYKQSWARLLDVASDRDVRLEHPAVVGGVWMTDEGRWILTWAADRRIRLWDGAGKLQRTIEHEEPIEYARPGNDREHLFSTTVAGVAHVWRRSDGALRAKWTPPEPILRIRFSPTGDRFLSKSAKSGTVRLWDLDGRQLAELRGHAAMPTRMRFAHGEDLILTCGDDGRAIVWNRTGDFLGAMTHPDAVTYGRFLPGDDRIVTTCADGVTRLWTRRGSLVAELRGHAGGVNLAGYDEEGKLLVTCGDDGTARLWPVRLKELLALADRRLCRDFAPEERQRYAALLK